MRGSLESSGEGLKLPLRESQDVTTMNVTWRAFFPFLSLLLPSLDKRALQPKDPQFSVPVAQQSHPDGRLDLCLSYLPIL